jgi:hypothetical protein
MLLTGPDHMTRDLGRTYFFHSPNNMRWSNIDVISLTDRIVGS